jgi:hypothetical protein
MQLDLAAIEAWPFVRFVATTPHAYAAVSALHILGIAVTVGAIVPADLRLCGWVADSIDDSLKTLARISIGGFVIAASAGVLLASVRIAEYVSNPFFLTKLAILTLIGANAAATLLMCEGRALRALAGRPSGKIVGLLSLALWATAVAAGRWIAFADA